MKHCKEDIGSVAGRVNSIQSLGTLDGPGIRFVVFVQGCNLRCGCCHNPDTWQMDGGTLYEAEELVKKAVRYKEYFADKGGVTVSGGEPLLQSRFVQDFFERCKREGINTCLDTSGITFDKSHTEKFDRLTEVCDLVLLDIKHMDKSEHLRLTGGSNSHVFDFMDYLKEKNKAVWVRHVLVPEITQKDEQLKSLGAYLKG